MIEIAPATVVVSHSTNRNIKPSGKGRIRGFCGG
jgi:hypothetical protein